MTRTGSRRLVLFILPRDWLYCVFSYWIVYAFFATGESISDGVSLFSFVSILLIVSFSSSAGFRCTTLLNASSSSGCSSHKPRFYIPFLTHIVLIFLRCREPRLSTIASWNRFWWSMRMYLMRGWARWRTLRTKWRTRLWSRLRRTSPTKSRSTPSTPSPRPCAPPRTLEEHRRRRIEDSWRSSLFATVAPCNTAHRTHSPYTCCVHPFQSFCFGFYFCSTPMSFRKNYRFGIARFFLPS